jgi:DNA modification methylase
MTPTNSIQDLAIEACRDSPKPLRPIYEFVKTHRPETAEETIRARIYEAMEQAKVVRVARGIYFARLGPAQLLLVEGDAWDVLKQLEENSVNALITDPPGKFGRDWAGMGTTRPHAKLGGRTYPQPELDEGFLREAFRVLEKAKEWNTLSKTRRESGSFPKGGAACLIRVPIENKTTRPHVQRLIELAESVGFVYYGEFIVALDKLGMGYDAGRDKGAKWLLFHAGTRNGVLWDLSVPNILHARRVGNPCSEDAVAHEAEKDPVEFTELIKAVTREGDVVLDPFCGRARWAKEALSMRRHVIASDIDGKWLDRIASEDFGFSGNVVSN